MIPTLIISFCCIRLVAYAKAFGGVEIGKIIALLDAIATPMSTVDVPPIAARLSPMAVHTTTNIGINRAAVAECEIRLDRP